MEGACEGFAWQGLWVGEVAQESVELLVEEERFRHSTQLRTKRKTQTAVEWEVASAHLHPSPIPEVDYNESFAIVFA